MLRRLIALTMASSVVLAGAVGAAVVLGTTAAGAADQVTVESNLCYQPHRGTCVDGAKHEFDAYLPSGLTQKAPGVVLVHGGSFIGGNKWSFAAIGTKLATDGIAAFSVNYRLDGPNVAGFPMESQDVMSAITYIRKPSRGFNSPERR